MRGLNIPGFSGGDRTALELPAPQEALIKTAVATGTPVIVVLTSGSAIAANDAAERATAVLAAWYGGEEAGSAIADTLAGANNPAGRLPVTFCKSADQLPPFTEYAMKGRTYRYFSGASLFATTGDARHLALARAFDHDAVFDPLARGRPRRAAREHADPEADRGRTRIRGALPRHRPVLLGPRRPAQRSGDNTVQCTAYRS